MPLEPTQKPDAADVNRFVEKTSEDYQGALEEWKKADSYYLQTYELWPNLSAEERANRPAYHSARGAAIVDQATDAVGTFAPKVTRPPTAGTQDAKEVADRVEKAVTELLEDSFITSVEHPAREAAKNGILYNYMLLFTGLDQSGMEDRPLQNEGETKEDFQQREEAWDQARMGWNPLDIRAVRPGEVLMDPMEKQPPIAVHRYKLKAHHLAALSLKKAKQQKTDPYFVLSEIDPYDLVDVERYFTSTWHGVKRKEGEWIYEPEPNTWGFQPWCHAWGGGGLTPVDADGFDTRYLARGFIQAVMDDIMLWDQAHTAVHNLLMRIAFARIGTRKELNEAVQELAGSLLQGDKDDWWTEVLPQLPPQIFSHMDSILNDIRLGSFDPQVGGFRQSGVETATQQLILSENSQRKFKILNTQLGHLFSIASANGLRLARHATDAYGLDSLSVGGSPLKVKDIGNNFRIFVSFENIDPVVHAQEKAQAQQELDRGLTSKEDYWKVARVSDATGMRKRILKDELYAMPEVHMEMLALMAKEEGLERTAVRLEDKARQLREEALAPTPTEPGETPEPLGANIGPQALERAVEQRGDGRGGT